MMFEKKQTISFSSPRKVPLHTAFVLITIKYFEHIVFLLMLLLHTINFEIRQTGFYLQLLFYHIQSFNTIKEYFIERMLKFMSFD